MAKRSIPQSKIDDTAFPVRLKIRVSGNGLGMRLTEALVWLTDNVPWFEHAHHAAGGAATFYFCDAVAA